MPKRELGKTIREAFDLLVGTWKEKDGIPIVDYSSQRSGQRKGRHAQSIDPGDFKKFLEETKPFDFDIMLEIKDKEKSALKAVEIASDDPRFKSVLQEAY
jgi:UV DNA damage endonuclease